VPAVTAAPRPDSAQDLLDVGAGLRRERRPELFSGRIRRTHELIAAARPVASSNATSIAQVVLPHVAAGLAVVGGRIDRDPLALVAIQFHVLVPHRVCLARLPVRKFVSNDGTHHLAYTSKVLVRRGHHVLREEAPEDAGLGSYIGRPQPGSESGRGNPMAWLTAHVV
jgi:hypothetical protein